MEPVECALRRIIVLDCLLPAKGRGESFALSIMRPNQRMRAHWRLPT